MLIILNNPSSEHNAVLTIAVTNRASFSGFGVSSIKITNFILYCF